MKPNTTPSTGFPFPVDFCGLNDLIWRLDDESTRLPTASFDAIDAIIQELYCLQDGLSQLRFDRWRKSEPEIDLFLDLLRGVEAGEGQ